MVLEGDNTGKYVLIKEGPGGGDGVWQLDED